MTIIARPMPVSTRHFPARGERTHSSREGSTQGKSFRSSPALGRSLPYLFLAAFLAVFLAAFFAGFLATFFAVFFALFFTATFAPLIS